MNVSMIMTVNVQTCRPDNSLSIAAEKMWKYDVGCLPVVDGQGHVLGMITDRDICIAGYVNERSLRNIHVSTVMSHEVFSCSPLDSIKQIEETMRSHKVHRVPVIDSTGKLAGIVSLNDLALEAEREVGRQHPDVTSQEIALTLATICTPRKEDVLIQAV